MPRNSIINRLHILIIIICGLRHCWHASYKECLCPGQLGCISIIRISSGLPGVQKKINKTELFAPFTLLIASTLTHCVKLSECISEYQQQHSLLIISVSTTAWLGLWTCTAICFQCVVYHIISPVLVRTSRVHWQVLDVPSHAGGVCSFLQTWTPQKETCNVRGCVKIREYGSVTPEIVKSCLCFIVVPFDWRSLWINSCSWSTLSSASSLVCKFMCCVLLQVIHMRLENWTLHSLISHSFSRIVLCVFM